MSLLVGLLNANPGHPQRVKRQGNPAQIFNRQYQYSQKYTPLKCNVILTFLYKTPLTAAIPTLALGDFFSSPRSRPGVRSKAPRSSGSMAENSEEQDFP